MAGEQFDEDYFERGVQSGKSLYENYRWLPELTIPLAAAIAMRLGLKRGDRVLDFGCAKGFLVHALRLIGIEAWGYEISEYAKTQAHEQAKPFILNDLNGPYWFDVVIAKDVLEHVSDLHDQLRLISRLSRRLFAVIPLGNGNSSRFIIPDMSKDVTHINCLSIDHWESTFKGIFDEVRSSTDSAGIKDRWSKYSTGHGFFDCRNLLVRK